MSYAEFRARARKSLSGKWFSMIFVYFIYTIIGGLFSGTAFIGISLLALGILNNNFDLSMLSNWADKLDSTTAKMLKDMYGNDYEEVIYRLMKSMAKTMGEMIPVLIAIIVISVALYAVVGSMITAGLYKQYYKLASDEEISVAGLFGSIKLWPKMLGITAIRYIVVYGVLAISLTMMWISKMVAVFALPVAFIGMIVVYFMFIMAPFVLVDEEDKSILDCIKESLNLMKGHIVRVLCLNLTFIGWGIVASFISNLLSSTVPIAVTIAQSCLSVYIAMAHVHYYMYLTGQDRYLYMGQNTAMNQEFTEGFGQGLDLNLDMNQGFNQDINLNNNQGVNREMNLNNNQGVNREMNLNDNSGVNQDMELNMGQELDQDFNLDIDKEFKLELDLSEDQDLNQDNE